MADFPTPPSLACAVMIRRLRETLFIEAFEHHALSEKIKNANRPLQRTGFAGR